MLQLFSKKESNSIPAAKKGEKNGRRTVLFQENGAENSLVEGVDFLVHHDYTHLPVLHKENAEVGAFYTTGGGCYQVLDIYRISEQTAKKHNLYFLDRVKYRQHWPENKRYPISSCALPGGEIRKN